MRILFVLFMMCIYSLLMSQDVEKKVIIKKSTDGKVITEDVKGMKKEKIVTVDVNKMGDSERTVKVITIDGADEKVMEWTDNGDMPAEVKKKLEEEGVNVFILDGDGEQGDIEIEEVIEIEWDGEGDIPEQLKILSEEHDIDIAQYLKEADSKGEKRIKMIKKQGGHGDQKIIRKRMKTENAYKMITIDDEGNETVMEWNGDGEMPKEMMQHMGDGKMKMHKGHGKMKMHKMGGRDMIFIADVDENDVEVSDAYMGAQIESADNGAVVLDLMKDSPADNAKLEKGDVIIKINGARTRSMEGLLGLLNHFEPNDKVELTIVRNGKEKNLKMTLGERPGHFR